MYLKLGHGRFLTNPFQFAVQCCQSFNSVSLQSEVLKLALNKSQITINNTVNYISFHVRKDRKDTNGQQNECQVSTEKVAYTEWGFRGVEHFDCSIMGYDVVHVRGLRLAETCTFHLP
jgi:hypothetical protein